MILLQDFNINGKQKITTSFLKNEWKCSVCNYKIVKVVSYKAVLILQGQSKRAVSVSDYKHLIFWDSRSIVDAHAKACHI